MGWNRMIAYNNNMHSNYVKEKDLKDSSNTELKRLVKESSDERIGSDINQCASDGPQ